MRGVLRKSTTIAALFYMCKLEIYILCHDRAIAQYRLPYLQQGLWQERFIKLSGQMAMGWSNGNILALQVACKHCVL